MNAVSAADRQRYTAVLVFSLVVVSLACSTSAPNAPLDRDTAPDQSAQVSLQISDGGEVAAAEVVYATPPGVRGERGRGDFSRGAAALGAR